MSIEYFGEVRPLRIVQPTMNLRWKKCKDNGGEEFLELQQQWVCRTDGSFEWRKVEVVDV